MAHSFETQPIEVERHFTGLVSNRNRLAISITIMGRRLITLYDALLTGSNGEITSRATLQRAAGYIPYNTNPISGVPQKFYAFQQTSTQSIFPIVDTTAGVFYVPPGSTAPTSLITKTQGQQSSFFGVGNYLYIGNREFSNKWDGPSGAQGITKWGIAIGSINNASGPNLAGAGANSGGAGVAWSNPGNVSQTSSSGPFAIALCTPANNTSQGLQATTFGLALVNTTTISGIQVQFFQVVSNATFCKFSVQMLKSGNPIGSAKIVTGTNIGSTLTLGGTGDLWGATWTPTDTNTSSFGFQVTLLDSDPTNNQNANVNNFKITVFGVGGPTVTVNASAGSFSATQGYQYLFVYGNSNDSNISNPTPASVSTGVFTNKLNVQISLTASTDPQVNQIRLFRTTDTGTGAVFFELPTSPYPNTTQQVNDTAADNALQITQAIVVGSLAFSPPPAGLVNLEWYAGRMWGSVGNLLYFSAGPDNAPMGDKPGASAWPPGNVFALPTSIVKNVALNGGNGMLVVTLDGIHVVQGITNPGFTVNKWLSDIGARQQNAVDTDGSNIFLYTSDNQFLRISAQGINELSQHVADLTDVLDATKVYVCQHRSGSQDSRVFLTDGSATIFPFNLMLGAGEGAWELPRTPADGGGVGAIGSIEISPGTFKLLKGATTAGQLILQRDLKTFTDNGTAYTWNVVYGNIPLADPTQLANVESIVGRFANAGNVPTCSILPNDISGSFTQLLNPVQEPPEAKSGPSGHRAMRFYLNSAAGPLWTQMTHLQLQFSFIAEPFQNEILSFGIFPNQSADQGTVQLPQIQGAVR